MLHQQQQQQRLFDRMDQKGSQQGSCQPALQLPSNAPQRRQLSLSGAAYPWAGMTPSPVTPQMQQAWNAVQDPPSQDVSLCDVSFRDQMLDDNNNDTSTSGSVSNTT